MTRSWALQAWLIATSAQMGMLIQFNVGANTEPSEERSAEQQLAAGDAASLSFEERFGLLIQHEVAARSSYRLTQRLRWAKLPIAACLEDLDTRAPRGITPAELAQVTDLAWVTQHLNVLITGPTGVGKSFLAAALAHAACRADFSVRCFRLPRWVDELARHTALHKRSTFFR